MRGEKGCGVGEKKDWGKLINGFLSCGFIMSTQSQMKLKVYMHSHLVLRSLVLSPLTPSQPGRDLSCNCRQQTSVWPELSKEPKTPSTTYNIGYMYVYYICMYVYMYNIHMCIHLPKFSFSSTIVFDPAKVWNLISDFDL